MTIVAEIIEEAFRESGLTNELQSPTPTQTKQALTRLQGVISSTYGFEAGDPLVDLPLTESYGPRDYSSYFANRRLIVTDGSPKTIYLPRNPDDGARVSLIDPKGLLVEPITVDANERTVEGVGTLDIVKGKTWFYRSDLGNWMSISPLTFIDEFPFPPEFDTYFITMLAVRLNPVYGKGLSQLTQETLSKSRGQIRARYKQSTEVPSELALTRTPKMVAGRSGHASFDVHDPNTTFDKGWSR